MRKRILVFLLSAAMVVGSLPAGFAQRPVYADEVTQEQGSNTNEENGTENRTTGSSTEDEQSSEEAKKSDENATSAREPVIRRIVRPGNSALRTYEFYVDGDRKDSQQIANGDYLTEPSKPDNKNGKVFQGWKVEGSEEFLSFGENNPITDITSSGTVRVNAVFGDQYTVTFHDRDGKVLKIRGGKPGDKINVDDVKFEVVDDYYVSGWTTDSDGSDTNKIEGQITLPTEENGGNFQNGNLNLYPIMKGVCWVFFDDGLGNDSSSSSYVKPIYVKTGEKASAPSKPTRAGYEFERWSTAKNGSESYNFDSVVRNSIVLYAVWKPVETRYTVQVLMEKLVDGKHVDGSYSPAGEYVPTDTTETKATAESIINPSNGQEGTSLNKEDIVKWFDEKSGVKNSYAWDFEKMDQDVVVKGDGTTVVHVYFRLHEFKVNFYLIDHFENTNNSDGGTFWFVRASNGSSQSGKLGYNDLKNAVNISYMINGKTYTDKDDTDNNHYSFMARVGEDIKDRFPGAQNVNATITIQDQVKLNELAKQNANFNDLKNMRPYAWTQTNYGKGHSAFNWPYENKSMTINLINESYSRNNPVDFNLIYIWQIDGIHKICYSMDENIENEEFSISNITENTTAAKEFSPNARKGYTWVFNTYEEECTKAPQGTSAEYPAGYPVTDETKDPKVFYFYYYRNRYALKFWNNGSIEKAYDSDDKTKENSKIKHGTPLKNYYFEPERPDNLDEAYQFQGWYTTENCADGTEFDFEKGTMPIANLNLYAKWSVGDVKVTLDTNGGTFTNSDQKTEESIAYGTSAADPGNVVRDGYIFAGWINEETMEPYHFSTKLFKDTKLIARWINSKSIRIAYDAGIGTNAPTDSEMYIDVSSAVVLKAPTVPANKYFYGWQFDGNVYQAGDIFTVLSRNAVKNSDGTYTITLNAVYGDKPFTGLTYDANGGIGGRTISNLPNTTKLRVLSNWRAGIFRNGYRFTGWNTKADGSGTSYRPGEEVIVDNVGENVLYAQWEKEPSYNNPGSGSPLSTVPNSNAEVRYLNTYDHYAYVIGYPDKSVHPSGEITRAETATIFFRLLTASVRDSEFAKIKQANQAAVYDDVKKGSWYYGAVAVMKDLRIIYGYPDGSFKPNAPITRAEFAAIAERFNKNPSGEEITYSDIAGHWAEKDIKHAAADGWINGYPDGTFKPNNKITRAESMAIVNRVLKRYPDAAYVFNLQNDPQLHVWTDNNDRTKWYYLDVQEATNSHTYHRTGTARVTNQRKYSYNTEWWDDATEAPNWERYQSVN